MSIAQRAPERRGEELAERVRAEDRSDDLRGSPKTLAHVGQQRDEDSKAQDIDDADEKQGSELFVQTHSQWFGTSAFNCEPGSAWPGVKSRAPRMMRFGMRESSQPAPTSAGPVLRMTSCIEGTTHSR